MTAGRPSFQRRRASIASAHGAIIDDSLSLHAGLGMSPAPAMFLGLWMQGFVDIDLPSEAIASQSNLQPPGWLALATSAAATGMIRNGRRTPTGVVNVMAPALPPQRSPH